MAKSISISKEFGLNPTVPVCIYCGKQKNEIAFLGTGYKERDEYGRYYTAQAPMSMAVDDTPCDACAEQFSRGIAFFENDERYVEHQHKITNYCTGRVVIITHEKFESFLKESELKDNIRAKGYCYVRPADYQQMFGCVEEVGA